MKKLLVTLLAVSSLFILSGCDMFNKKENKEQKEKTKEETKEEKENNELENDPNAEYEEEKPKDTYTVKDGYVVNNRTNEKYEIYSNFQSIIYDSGEVEGLYIILGEKGIGIYNDNDKVFINPEYSDVSCMGHTGEDYTVCTTNGDLTLLSTNDSMKLVSVKTGNILISGDKIHELSNGKFVVKKGDIESIYDDTAKELLKANYIGYSNEIGYIAIENDKVSVYDDNFKKISLPSITKDVLVEKNEHNILVAGDALLKLDINNNKYIKYNGNETGTKTILMDICGKGYAYIIDNDKATKLNNVEFKDYVDSSDFCR